MKPRTRPKLLILSSPSGAGKTTLCRRLIKTRPEFELSISHTTRLPRAGEAHGREYYFVDRNTFDGMLDADQFIESAEVHGNMYGTAKDEFTRIFSEARTPVCDIDWQGTVSVQSAFPEALSIFILPPTMKALSERLKRRKTESEAALKLRLANAAIELEKFHFYRHMIINDEVDTAFSDLLSIIDTGSPVRPAPTTREINALLNEVG
ncbi:MAG: guanylate kinase [Myxococcota bacterium]|nr:guanylate kinase [Myxococcota bacterium]